RELHAELPPFAYSIAASPPGVKPPCPFVRGCGSARGLGGWGARPSAARNLRVAWPSCDDGKRPVRSRSTTEARRARSCTEFLAAFCEPAPPAVRNARLTTPACR